MKEHNIEPIFNSESRVLILGSFPSVVSREVGFFYSHPTNRFWKVLSITLKEKEPNTIEEKKELLLKNKIALWDVVDKCEIDSSNDNTIRNVVVCDIDMILSNSKVKRIFCDGRKAYELYNKYLYNNTKIKAIYLPSTSSRNASYSLEDLINCYKVILEFIK